MAIDLNSVKKAKNPKTNTVSFTGHSKEQIARPWESFDGMGPTVRTVQAHEAIRKINSRNDRTSDDSTILSFKVYKSRMEAQGPRNIYSFVNAPLQGAGLVGFIRRLFS